ncbi:MAG TPA: CDP-diacylglycerol--glycerol-3-phosphate 3-phosphatidyltransferase [Chthoniobacteraceae bacterium]|nr:CDP-diacylglycerol--glycerol-3-phosphate 3-phosphatidyltransferase [Chthoniobacteraceae bacterium]
MRRDAPIAFQPQFPLYHVEFMTTANKITIARILMIPLFVLMAIYYGRDKEVWQRWSAVAIFVVAAASDGIDGYIARRHNQRSALGVILDPLADKGLLLAGIITLTFSNWGYEFPLWFPVLVIARDIIVVAGAVALQFLNGTVRVRPSWTGKVATVLQMIAIGMVMLQWNALGHDLSVGHHVVHISFLDLPVVLAGLFTAISGFGYVVDGIAQLQAKGHGDPRPWNES